MEAYIIIRVTDLTRQAARTQELYRTAQKRARILMIAYTFSKRKKLESKEKGSTAKWNYNRCGKIFATARQDASQHMRTQYLLRILCPLDI